MRMRRLILALLMAAIAGCAAQPRHASVGVERPKNDGHFAGERSAIHALRVANNRAIAARDVNRTMLIAAEDYVLVSGSDTIIRSAEAMRARWTESFRDSNQGGCVRQPEQVEVGQNGGVLRAAETGRWRCPRTTPGGEAEPYGSYFAHWSKRSGEWRVVSDNYVTLGCRGKGC
jgi:ketosteroid isomerase-like protein